MIAKERFYELRNQQGLINTEELDEVFNALDQFLVKVFSANGKVVTSIQAIKDPPSSRR